MLKSFYNAIRVRGTLTAAPPWAGLPLVAFVTEPIISTAPSPYSMQKLMLDRHASVLHSCLGLDIAALYEAARSLPRQLDMRQL